MKKPMRPWLGAILAISAVAAVIGLVDVITRGPNLGNAANVVIFGVWPIWAIIRRVRSPGTDQGREAAPPVSSAGVDARVSRMKRLTACLAAPHWTIRVWVLCTVIWLCAGLVYLPWARAGRTQLVPCLAEYLTDYDFGIGDGDLDKAVENTGGLCSAHPVTILARAREYALDIKLMVPTPEFLSILVLPISGLIAIWLVRWVIGKRALAVFALPAGTVWRFVQWASAWMFARRRSLAVWAVVLAALWIFRSHAQNGRYAFQLSTRGLSTVLDTRDGTAYTFYGNRWMEFHPQTGDIHYISRPPR